MIGNLLGGRYELLEVIGTGGMATVYKAKCRLLNRYVAIKILKDEFARDEEFVTKFRMESQAAASLSHSNIVNIYDVGTDEIDGKAVYYIVMEYVKGETLKDKLRREGKFGPARTIEYTREIGLALKEAHRNDIIHRDIKPQNIMVDEDNQIKVMDFGIARAATSSTISSTSEALGSVHYFSPEQARGGYTDERSDIYSLGIVMYEMATGELPYKGESPITVALKHVQEDIVPPRELNSNIPQALEDIILKCVEKKQVDRFKNLDEVIAALDRVDVRPVQKNSMEDTSSFTQVLPTEEIKKEAKKMKKNKKAKSKSKGSVKGSILGIVSAFVIVLGVFFGKNYVMTLFKSEEITMPDLTLQTEAEAKKMADDLGITYTINRKPVENEKAGIVIEQDPVAGTKFKKDYPVVIVISENGGPVEVPDFLNQNIYQAETIARRMKLKLSPSYVKSETGEAGKIIEQDIPAGREVEAGTVITVKVTQGKEETKIVMPKLLALTLDEAKAELAKNNLKLGSAHEEASSEPKGTIVWQSYPTGEELNKNTVVSVKISDGNGKKETDKEKEKEEKDKDKEKEDKKDDKQKMNPVQLTINVAKEGTVIRVERSQNGETTTVYNQSVSAGDVRIGTEGLAGARFDIYADGALIDSVTK